MKSKTISVILTLLLIGAGSSGCGDPSGRSKDNARGRSVGSDERGPGQGQGRGQGRGQGLGRRATGKGRRGQSTQPNLERFEPVSLTNDEWESIGLETVEASYRALDAALPAMGKVVAPPRTKAIVSYAFPARISEVHVRLGDWVKKGQKVLTLQSEEVGNAKSEFYKARADFELAKKNYERQKRLLDRGVGAQKDYLLAEAEFTVARFSHEAAEKKLHILGFTEEQIQEMVETHQINPTITLYAPIGGKIVENNAVMGDMVDQDAEILTIMNPNLLRVDTEIYEKDIAKIREGQQVEVRVPAYPNEVFTGRIQYVSDIFKEDTRTITVHTEVANTDYKLKPGMFADITIHLNHHDRVIALPKEAILDDKDLELVFVRRGDEYIPLVIETGVRQGEYVQILSGIQEGDVVVTSGNFQLKSKMYEDILSKGHVH
jgi:cobalt-zinc-cadmium efflux system membrane fusion protein